MPEEQNIFNNEFVKILLVEDEVITAMYIKMELNKSGFRGVRSVGTGERAIEIAIVERPDLILMDVNLAGKLNGLDAAKEILKTYSPHIIFMTGYQDEIIIKDLKDIQPSMCITKPIDHARMILLIKHLIVNSETKPC